MSAAPMVVEVRLVGVPIALYHRSAEHHDELRREFALLGGQGDGHGDVPKRLVELIANLESRFGTVGERPEAELAAAAAAGVEVMDLTYHVPTEARAAVEELGRLLDEADEFCRRGEHLLTLAAPSEIHAFRQWFLGQFIAQIDGARPTPWDTEGAASSTGA